MQCDPQQARREDEQGNEHLVLLRVTSVDEAYGALHLQPPRNELRRLANLSDIDGLRKAVAIHTCTCIMCVHTQVTSISSCLTLKVSNSLMQGAEDFCGREANTCRTWSKNCIYNHEH